MTGSNPPPSADAITILIPTYNDWDALFEVLSSLDQELEALPGAFDVVVLDDGSSDPMPVEGDRRWTRFRRVDVVRLRRNLGHQRAIAVGLCFLVSERTGRGIIVMDGDGEDQPADVSRLVPPAGPEEQRTVVFAERIRRSEGFVFTVFYRFYRVAHRLLTGIPVRMGNFSFLPWRLARRLVVAGELWNHYAAAVIASKIPYRLVPCPRGHRIRGTSKMNFVSLVTHGLSAIAVFSDRLGVRVLAATAVTSALAITGLLAVFLGQLVLLSVVFTFVVLGGRARPTVIPLRDYQYFVEDVNPLWPR